jgi:hypothetical protein
MKLKANNALPGLTPVWLAFFALALTSLVLTAAPIIAGSEPVKLSDWLGFSGSVIGAIMTLIAAIIAWNAVRKQLRRADEAAERTRLQNEFSYRAMLPFSLSALIEYADLCIEQLDSIRSKIPAPFTFVTHEFGHEARHSLSVPALPSEHLEILRCSLLHIDHGQSDFFFDTMIFLQIQNARHRSLMRKLQDPDHPLTQHQVQRAQIDALDLYAMLSRLFEYARGKDYRAAKSSSEALRTAFDLKLLSDSDYPLILTEIDGRGR